MISETTTLSTFNSQELKSSLEGVSFKQFKRTFPGNFSFNFSHALSSTNDFSVKNYTNFYLTNNFLFSDVFNISDEYVKADYIFGPISYGSEYLNYSPIDPTPYASIGQYENNFNYGVPVFGSSPNNFTIKLFSNNKCNIYYTKDNKKYYLCVDVSNKLSFVRDKLITFSSDTINPQDFTYMYSEDTNFILLFKKTEYSELFITKQDNLLVAVDVTNDNIATYIANPFKISKNIYYYPNISLDNTFITYNNDNTIDISKSRAKQHNNFLIHKKYSNVDNNCDILVLKNQLSDDDIYSTSNNLLSGGDLLVYADHNREYTSICKDIDEEEEDSLNLNFVFYNKSYKISPGNNTFISPSSMHPFEVLNINDSKFVSSGAFSYITPKYADKVYHLSNESNNFNNGQHLLCTWLSGHPTSNEKVWMDRYYYPDLIEKEEALGSKPAYSVTYDDYIETLINNNTGLKNSIKLQKVFDKISDLAFTPNQKYNYERISIEQFPSLSSNITNCSISTINPPNYFKSVNSSGELTVYFNFKGDSSNWVIESNRNAVDSGISIEKIDQNIVININLYDATQSFYDLSDSSWFRKSITLSTKQLKDNFIAIGLNSKTGKGYFYFNNEIVSIFDIPLYQFLTKRLLYGDFYLYVNQNKIDPFKTDYITNFSVSDQYIDHNIIFLSSFNNKNIEDIYITLPCGMRNGMDEITTLNSICGSSTFKSNSVNVIIKNVGIDNINILNGIRESISTSVSKSLPVNISLNKISFQDFK